MRSHPEKWTAVKTLIRVTTERRGASTQVEAHTRLYISSLDRLDAAKALAITRKHWGVENKLHWLLDVAFREDESRVYAANAAENLVVIRHMALNFLRSVKNVDGGIRSRRNAAGWDDSVRERVLCASLK